MVRPDESIRRCWVYRSTPLFVFPAGRESGGEIPRRNLLPKTRKGEIKKDEKNDCSPVDDGAEYELAVRVQWQRGLSTVRRANGADAAIAAVGA